MIKVGFIGAVSIRWMGGLNYFKNLLYALSLLDDKELEVFVFIGKNRHESIKKVFSQYATVVEDSIFDKNSIKWFFYDFETRFFKTNYLLKRVLDRHGINVLSHSGVVNIGSIKTINWIPDFQHLHLPEMFSKQEVINRDTSFLSIIKQSDKIVLSSYDALNDFKSFSPDYIYKAHVLQFVSQPDKSFYSLSEADEIKIRNKYDLKQDFFYIPNQFWKHKNHMLVFEAVRVLSNEGVEICVVCSGRLEDYRDIDYIEYIKDFIIKNRLEENIKLLGFIKNEDVFSLIKFSKAVINPSLFEGWSSTVEECKSVNKNMILSDINVHAEQYEQATFFEKNNVNSLVYVLKNYQPDTNVRFDSLDRRTKEYAMSYLGIIKSLQF